MMALLLRVVLLLQFALIGAVLAVAIGIYHTENIVLAGLGAIAFVLVLRIILTANNFFMARHYAAGDTIAERLPWRGRLVLFAREFYATMLSSSWTMLRHKPDAREFAGSATLPVLLIHGYGCNGANWHEMSAALSRARIGHRCIDLEPLFAGIDDYAPMIGSAIDAMSVQRAGKPVIVVAHSMGGLAIRAYLRATGDVRVAHVITLGSPHHGTGLANHGIGLNCKQMRGRRDGKDWVPNDWLFALGQSETAQDRARITSVYSLQDNIVSPRSSAILGGAENIAVSGIGHVTLALDASVHKLTIALIVKASAAEQAARHGAKNDAENAPATAAATAATTIAAAPRVSPKSRDYAG